MQTTGIPSSHSVSPRNTENSTSKNAHASQGFGEAMHRALGGIDDRSQQQANHHASASEKTSAKDKSDSDEIRSEKKHAKAKRNSDHAVTPQFLGMVVPSATPQPSPTPANGGTDSPDGATGGATPILTDATTTETVDAASDEDTESATQSSESAQPEGAQADETQISAENSKHPQPIDPALAQQLAAQSSETDSAAANPAEAAALSEADQQDPELSDATSSLAQAGASPTGTHGTSAAKQDVTMKKAEKMQKVAGPTEQDLPGMTLIGGEEPPKGQKLSAKEDGHGSAKLDSVSVEMPVRVVTSSDTSAPTVTAAAPAESTPLDARTLERTHDIVALHAMRVGEYTSDSMRVVVKPGAGIQLSLELRQSARGIEVQASLHKGDFAQLNQHWPDLQQRLEARGIRVADLTTPENFSSTSHQQFQQSKQQSPNQDPLYAGAFAEFALAGSMNEAPAARAARATAYRGWETWA